MKKISVVLFGLIVPFLILAVDPTPTISHTPGAWMSYMDYPVTDGTVEAITLTADSAYIGGGFTYIGKRTGKGAPISISNGSLVTGFPEIQDGTVQISIPDGSGGWYVGGSFTRVAGITRNRLIHIYSNGSLDPVFNPDPNGIVYSLLLTNDGLYAGGAFTTVSGVSINRLAKINPATGVPDTAFNPNVSGTVYALAYDGTYIYCGGLFTLVNGISNPNLAKIDALSGSLISGFMPSPSNSIRTLLYSQNDDSIFAGGTFSSIGGMARNNLAKLSAGTGQADPLFAPNPGSTVRQIAFDGTSIYAAGSFYSISNTAQARLAKVDAITGAFDAAFRPLITADFSTLEVYSVVYLNNTVYFSGYFHVVNGERRLHLGAVDAANAQVSQTFNPNSNATVLNMSTDGNRIFAGGVFNSVAGLRRVHLAKFNLATGEVDPVFNARISHFPNYGTEVREIDIDNLKNIYIAGNFSGVGDYPRNNLAKVSGITGEVDHIFNPYVSATINDLLIRGSSLYLCGQINSVDGVTGGGVVKLNYVNGQMDTNFSVNAIGVYTLFNDVLNDRFYMGGNFASVNTLMRAGLAKINPDTGIPDPAFDANLSEYATVFSMDTDGTSLYIGGTFHDLSTTAINYYAKVSALTGVVDLAFDTHTPRDGSHTHNASGLALYNNTLFLSGELYMVGGVSRPYFAGVTADSGALMRDFNPNPSGNPYTILLSHDRKLLFIGGGFMSILGDEMTGIAAMCLGNQPSPVIYTYTITPTHTISRTYTVTSTPTATRTKAGTDTFTRTFTNTGTFTRTATVTITNSPFCSITPTFTITVPAVMPTSTFTPVEGGLFTLERGPATNGSVLAITVTASDVYLGGNFSRVGPRTGQGAPVNASTGIIVPGFPKIYGTVYGSAPDGTGGWYVSGSFQYVNGIALQRYLIHVFSNGALDPAFNPSPNSSAKALYYDGTYLYVSGNFSLIGGILRTYMAKLNPTSGAGVSIFNTALSGPPNVIIPAGNGKLFIGGSFNGPTGNNIAKIDAMTGAIDYSFSCTTNGEVKDLVYSGGALYVGGYFTSINGNAIKYAAKIDPINGTVDTAFNPAINGNVNALAAGGSGIFVGGDFSVVNNVSRIRMACLDPLNASLISAFKADADNFVYELSFIDGSLYAGGSFKNINGTLNSYAAKLDAFTGAIDPLFKAWPDNMVFSLNGNGTDIFAGGIFNSLNSISRNNIVKFNAATGVIDEVFPDTNGTVHALAYQGTQLYAGGDFTMAGGFERQRLVKINTTTGNVDTAFYPSFDDTVRCLLPYNSDIFAGGLFKKVWGAAKYNLAKFRQADGVMSPSFNTEVVDSVYALASDGSNLYIAASNKLFKVDTNTGLSDPVCRAVTDTTILSVGYNSGNVYIGGVFNQVNGTSRNGFARLNAITAVVDTSFNPSIYSVYSFWFDGLGGVYCGLNNASGSPVARYFVSNGLKDTSFASGIYSGYVYAVTGYGWKLYTGGSFDRLLNMPVSNYASFYIGVPPAPTVTNTRVNTSVYTPTRTSTVSRTITPTFTITPTRTVTPTFTKDGTDTVTATNTMTRTNTPQNTGTPTYTITMVPVYPTATFAPSGAYRLLDHIIVDGTVLAITATANDVYIGGSFSTIYTRTGSLVTLNPASGSMMPGFPEVSGGQINDIISDGDGGWYIGGTFRHVAGQNRPGVAHVFANYSLDPNFEPVVSGTGWTVNALAYDGRNVYIAGEYTHLNGVPRSGLGKVDAVTGVLDTGFDALMNTGGNINAVVLDGTGYLYVAGQTSSFGGVPKPNAARINSVSGALDPVFHPAPSGEVYCILLNQDRLYIGGYFSNVSGVSRRNLAKIETITGYPDLGFKNTNINNTVYALEYNSGSLYVGGYFDTVDGYFQSHLAKLDGQTGIVDLGFNAPIDSFSQMVTSLCFANGSIYAAGKISDVGGLNINRAAKFDPVTGAVDAGFKVDVNSIYIYALQYTSGKLYMGGAFNGTNPQSYFNLARVKVSTGNIDPAFKPSALGQVNVLYLDKLNNLYIGGTFNTFEGYVRNKIAKIDLASGLIDQYFKPSIACLNLGDGVNSILSDGTSVYIGGVYLSVNGAARDNLAKVSAADGSLDGVFNASANGAVMDLFYEIGSLYVSGQYDRINGYGQHGFSRLSAATGALDTSYQPGVDGKVNKAVRYENSFYLGGEFYNVGLKPRAGLAKINVQSGALDNNFNTTDAANWTKTIAYDGSSLYVGGTFSSISGISRSRLAKLDGQTAAVDMAFDPDVYMVGNPVVMALAMAPAGDVLYVGGDFFEIMGEAAADYAAIYLGPPPSHTATPTISTTHSVTLTKTLTNTRTITLTKTITNTHTCTYTPTESATFTATPTPEASGTDTPYHSPTETGTITQTHTVSPTFTITQTETITPTITQSETDTYTMSPTLTGTETFTFTVTGTHTSTGTTTPVNTATRTVSVTCTSTITPTYTSSLTRTATVPASSTNTVTLSATVTTALSPTSTHTMTPEATPFIQADQVLIYPNPSIGDINIRFKDGMGAQIIEITVYTVSFRKIRKILKLAVVDNSYTIKTGNIASGTYIIQSRLLKDGKQIYKNVKYIVLLK